MGEDIVSQGVDKSRGSFRHATARVRFLRRVLESRLLLFSRLPNDTFRGFLNVSSRAISNDERANIKRAITRDTATVYLRIQVGLVAALHFHVIPHAVAEGRGVEPRLVYRTLGGSSRLGMSNPENVRQTIPTHFVSRLSFVRPIAFSSTLLSLRLSKPDIGHATLSKSTKPPG